VILGGFLGTPSLYRGMQDRLGILTGGAIHVVPVGLRHWAATTRAAGWLAILLRLDRTVALALEEGPADAVTLVGHSSGGVMGRLYLSPEPFEGHRFAGLEKVRHLITLGSPHHNVRGARLRRWVDRTLPGAHFAPGVAYTTVAGRAIRGDPGGSLKERGVARLYRHLCGRGDVWGDGLVPVPSARLEGAREVVLDGVYHAPLAGARWFGSGDVVPQWWSDTPTR
jgi:hypothetical protein